MISTASSLIELTSAPPGIEEVDLICATYPDYELSQELFEAIVAGRGSVLLFRIDRKMRERLLPQLQQAVLAHGSSGTFHFLIQDDPDHSALQKLMDEKIGPGQVSDEDIRSLLLNGWEAS